MNCEKSRRYLITLLLLLLAITTLLFFMKPSNIVDAKAESASDAYLLNDNDEVISDYSDVASYNKSTKTLTLTNANINVGNIGEHIKEIHVVGDNTLILSNGSLETDDLTINGTGTLNFNGIMWIDGDFNVDGVTLNVKSSVGELHDILVMGQYRFTNTNFTFTAEGNDTQTVALDMWGGSDGHKQGLIENSTMVFNLNNVCKSALQLGTIGNDVNLTIRNSNITTEGGYGLLNYFDSDINYDSSSYYYVGRYNGKASEAPNRYEKVSLDSFLLEYKNDTNGAMQGSMGGYYNRISTRELSEDEQNFGYVLRYHENTPESDDSSYVYCETKKYGEDVHVNYPYLPEGQYKGYTFAGWSTNSNAKNVDFKNDTVQKPFLSKNSGKAEFDLYGVWKDKNGKIVKTSNKNGKILYTSTVNYKVLGADTVSVCGIYDDSMSDLYTFDTVTDEDNNVFKVTAVSSGACKNNKKLKSLRLGKNITSIGNNAFKGCSKVRSIYVESTKINKIGNKAFSGLGKNVAVYVPKSKFGKYKKMLIKAGIGKNAKFYKR